VAPVGSFDKSTLEPVGVEGKDSFSFSGNSSFNSLAKRTANS